jgi:hypothetical protein
MLTRAAAKDVCMFVGGQEHGVVLVCVHLPKNCKPLNAMLSATGEWVQGGIVCLQFFEQMNCLTGKPETLEL